MWSDHINGAENPLTSAPIRLHETVVKYVESELAAGRLPVGSRLPAERTLATQLGVSRTSVREGIRILEAMGVIRTAPGSGPDAGAIVVADTPAGITSALRLHLAARTLPVEDIVRTRILVESWSAEQAARHGDPDLLATAGELLIAMDRPGLAATEFLTLDAGFHIAVAQAAGNEVVTAIMTSLRASIEQYVTAAVPRLPDWPAMQRRLRRQHHNILSVVRAGDGPRAARLMSAHIAGFFDATRPSDSKIRRGVEVSTNPT